MAVGSEPVIAKDKPYLFVSYAHADSKAVLAEIGWLSDRGFNIWYDDGIHPGSSWRNEIAAAIEGCSVFLYFVTPRSALSANCERELHFAADRGKVLLAVHLEPTELPSGIELTLGTQQAILKYKQGDEIYRERLLAGLGGPASEQNALPIASRKRTPIRRWGWAGAAVAVLCVAVFLQNEQGSLVESSGSSATPIDSPSIAVLPFENMSTDPDQEYFGDGLAEDVLNGLVNSTDLKIIGRSTSFSYKRSNLDVATIGEALQVSHLVEGSVRKAGSRIRVTAQLTETATGASVWSEQYDRNLTDVFAVQDEVTQAILGALNRALDNRQTIAPRTINAEAYNAFLRSRYHFQRLEIEKSLEASQLAIALDPDYSDAYALSASSYNVAIWWGVLAPERVLPLVIEHTNKALELDPNNVAALSMQAAIVFFVNSRHQDALDRAYRLLESNPDDTGIMLHYMTMLQTVDEYDQPIALARRTLELEPLNPAAHRQLAEQLLYVGALEEAKASALRAEDLGLETAGLLSRIAVAMGDMTALETQVARADAAWGNAVYSRGLSRIALLLGGGEVEKASTLATQLAASPEFQDPRARYYIRLYQQDLEGALDAFESLMDSGDFYIIRGARGTQDLRHPRYLAALEKVGLDDASIAKLRIQPLPF
jgi:TolB-like protein